MSDFPSYPAVRFIVRYGALTAVAVPVLLLAVWIAVWLVWSLPAWTVVAAAGVSVVLFGLLRSYVELVQIISETLLPR